MLHLLDDCCSRIIYLVDTHKISVTPDTGSELVNPGRVTNRRNKSRRVEKNSLKAASLIPLSITRKCWLFLE
jgi:predicted phosphodiesterase